LAKNFDDLIIVLIAGTKKCPEWDGEEESLDYDEV